MTKTDILNMLKNKKNWKWFALGVVLILIIGYSMRQPAEAGSYSPSVTNITNINVMSSSESIAKGVAAAMAAGGHQFDYSTNAWQGSVTGAFQMSQEDENNLSFAVGKRFNKALMHFTYTPASSDTWVMMGGTFRFE